MGKLIYLAFEELPQRYTKMWNDSFIKQMQENDIVVKPTNEEKIIACGEFLDVYDTIAYKSKQMEQVARLFQEHKIENGDVFFVPDIFFPSMEAIRYMSELAGVSVSIIAFNHAGRADKTDFVQQLNKWADNQEQVWHDICDLVICGSQFHSNQIQKAFNRVPVVTGAIWDKGWMDNKSKSLSLKKENYVIYPHRLCEEKDIDLFIRIAEANQDIKFVVCSGGNKKNVYLPSNVEYKHNLTKQDYFQTFAKARWYLSTAKQETFGYTLQEAIYFSCGVVVPDRACYREYVDKNCLYNADNMWKKPTIFADMLKKDIYKCKQMYDNAKTIYQLCTTFKKEWR